MLPRNEVLIKRPWRCMREAALSETGWNAACTSSRAVCNEAYALGRHVTSWMCTAPPSWKWSYRWLTGERCHDGLGHADAHSRWDLI